ncbi:TIR domain-containing protein [Mesorhizobium humile]|uniref:TIR domain-containing protein n=1 Tax=Mesorhizobium humile TaxID=3072313 RepID=A0ABU4YUX6_9HYPH|nr:MULTISPECIES: TIR domain-containing protein [unclassified Mesorhizobium]MDX8462132.1 TIR domain-containing protein [Mesorhizobium sp. VK2D]MDX8489622.1 TIR domain-containing protein [Mesorhizobium sp. VK2B]
MPLLEEVFKLSGVPTYTFVEPLRYDAILVAVRTPGRSVVLEGPSGIGKTSTITKVIEALGKAGNILSLSARKPNDLEMIDALPTIDKIGTVVIDDFHRLNDGLKARLSDFMKLLADSGDENSQLILLGINKAGDQLVHIAHDLGMRIDIFKLESNPDEKIEELISKGEDALNIRFRDKVAIALRSQGSFHIAQVLCHALCIEAGVTETQLETKAIDYSVDVVVERIMTDLGRQFMNAAISFAQGSKIRREGRAPYLHILRWLSQSEDWSLDLQEALRAHPEHKASISQVLEKGFFETLLRDKADVFGSLFHYEPTTRVLSVEDPKFIFFLRNLVWRPFAKNVGFAASTFKSSYDFALSFAGAERAIAKRLFDILTEREIAVFYDENEQHNIVARDVEEYLGRIYRSDATYVVPLLSQAYPTRIWTKFESDNFRDRFGKGAVIPVRFTDLRPGMFSDEQRYGGVPYNPAGDMESPLQEIANVLSKRLAEDRAEEAAREAVKVEREVEAAEPTSKEAKVEKEV